MKDLNHARALLEMAHKDLKALAGMSDTETFVDEVYGFHAQQVVEKTLKAWLVILGCDYSKTHNIRVLRVQRVCRPISL